MLRARGLPLFVALVTFVEPLPSGADADPNDQWWDGFGPGGKGFNDWSSDAVVYDGRLVVGGQFTRAGNNLNANRIGRFNGAGWLGMDLGMSDGSVIGLRVHNGDLYAGGSFTEAGGVAVNFVARWDGADWHAVGSGLGDWVRCFGEYQGELIIGGWFDTIDGSPGNAIARWDGVNWAPLGGGLTSSITGDPSVHAMAEHGGYLYVVGSFDGADGIPVDGIARWDGTSWSAVADLTPGNKFWVRLTEEVLVDANGDLVVAGDFTHVNGMPAMGIARWDGTQWVAMDSGLTDCGFLDLAVFDGGLVATGYFAAPDGGASVAYYDGSAWSGGFGDGLDTCDLFGGKRRIAVYEGEVYIVGRVCYAGLKVSNWIARWAPPDPTSVALADFGSLGLRIAGANPVADATEIAFDLPRETNTDLAVFDVQGRRLATLHAGDLPAGRHSVRWLAHDDAGTAVANGVYFVRLEAAGEMQTVKVVVAR